MRNDTYLEPKVHHLPNYSAERFFLLSELKLDGVRLKCLDGSVLQDKDDDQTDHSNDHNQSDHSNENNKHKRTTTSPHFSLVYLVWKQGEVALETLKSEIDRLLKACPKGPASKVAIFIESHTEAEGQGLQTAKDVVRYLDQTYHQKILMKINKNNKNNDLQQISCRLVAVSNNTGACPALEQCVALVKSSRFQRHTFHFIIRNKIDMLGIDSKLREPDAVDDVWQCIVGGMVPVASYGSHEHSETKSTNTDSSSSSRGSIISSNTGSSGGMMRAGMLPTQIPVMAKDTAQLTTPCLEQTASTAVWVLALALGAAVYIYCLQGMQGEAQQQRHSDL